MGVWRRETAGFIGVYYKLPGAKATQENKDSYRGFIISGYEKGFDSVNREEINWKCMAFNAQMGWLSQLVWGLSIRLENCIHDWVWWI